MQRNMELLRENLGELCLSDSGRAYEEEASYGLAAVHEACLGHQDCLRDRLYGLVLTVNPAFETLFHVVEVILYVLVRSLHVGLAYVCEGLVYGPLGDFAFALGRAGSVNACLCGHGVCTRLVKQVDRLVRQAAVEDVSAAHADCVCCCVRLILYVVML